MSDMPKKVCTFTIYSNLVSIGFDLLYICMHSILDLTTVANLKSISELTVEKDHSDVRIVTAILPSKTP